MKPGVKPIHKILVVTLSNLGDVVLTLPVFQSLATAFPRAEMHTVVSDRAKEVFENDERIKKIIVYEKRVSLGEKITLLKQIRRERYDLIVDLRRSLIGLLGGARRRNSYFHFTDRRMHRTERHLLSLKGLVALDSTGDSGRASSWLSRVTELTTGSRQSQTVVAAVGSKSDIKKWPFQSYARLLDRLIAEDGCRVILVGDKNDAKDAEKVRSLMLEEVTDLSGRTNFRELCRVLRQADLLITNDSAPLHIADGLRIPTLAIFGPTDPRKYGPRLSYSQVASHVLFCAPCERAQCRYGHECMRELGADEVYARARAMLQDHFMPKNLNILLVRLDRIGDLVLSLPAIGAIRERFPNARISVVTRAATQTILEGHPDVDEVIPYHYEKKGRHRFFLGYFRFLGEIMKRRFDVAFILHPSVRSHLFPFLAGIPYRIGFDTELALLLTKKVLDRRHEGERHESDYTLDIVRAWGVEASRDLKTELPVYQDETNQILKLLQEAGWNGRDPLVAVHPGASCPSKRWPKERFVELIGKILSGYPHAIGIVGGAEEKKDGEFIRGYFHERVFDLTGKLNLKQLAAFLKKSDLLVTNDSGPVHIAAAVGTPTVTIFGRNQAGLSVKRWRALGEGHRVIQKDVGCVVCLAHRCTIDFECLKAVGVEEVYCTLKNMISG